jgi:hypothetical protein
LLSLLLFLLLFLLLLIPWTAAVVVAGNILHLSSTLLSFHVS